MKIITIDTGTTNTRVCLWNDFGFIDSIKRPVGVRNSSIDGNNLAITQGIATAIQELLGRHNQSESEINLVIAAGMITSNLGLTEVPHLIAPAKLSDFASHIHRQIIPEVCSIPIHFIPGLKNPANHSDGPIEARDVMRGEEVETLALLDLTNQKGATTFILPGSHTKFVAVNDDHELVGCCTTLAGELTSVVTHNTILSSSLQNRFTEQVDKHYLLQGADSNNTVGLTRSLFSVRVLEQTTEANQSQLASFLLGVIVSEDIKALRRSSALTNKAASIGIYGNSPVSEAFKVILDSQAEPINSFMIEDEISNNLSGYGCLLVAKAANLIG